MWFESVMCLKEADRMAKGVDPDLTAPTGGIYTVCPDLSVGKKKFDRYDNSLTKCSIHSIIQVILHIRPKIKNCLFAVPLPSHFYPPYPKLFLALLEYKSFLAPFSSENHDFLITQQCKKKKYANKIFFLLPYPPSQKIQGRGTANK